MCGACRAGLVIGAALWFSGCAVGPDYDVPVIPVPKLFGSASLEPGSPTPPARADYVRWWQILHDQELNSLIERAVLYNPDLEIALGRVQEARTQEIVVVNAMLPKVGGNAAAALGSGTDNTKGRAADSLRAGDASTGLKGINRIAGFDAGWELDFFGKYQRLLEATVDDAEAQNDLRNEVLITVIADVARYYFDIRGLQARLQIARNNVATGQKLVEVLTTRFDRGLSNELDLTLARRELATLQAQIPQLTAAISAVESQLALLVGTYAGEIDPELRRNAKLPHTPERLRAGVPIDLLRRRPDIRAAERQLAAATARIGVATADLFPSVALTAGFGAQGGTRSGPTAPLIHGPIWSVGPGAYWPLLDFGRLDALIHIQEFRAQESAANYRKTILGAVEDVDQAVKQYRFDEAQLKALARALTASQRAVDLATERYERGVTDFLNVLDAERQEFILQDRNAVAEEAIVIQFVAFYKALGGGWELFDSLPPLPDSQPALIATVRRLTDGWR
jgi:NodT family efflux transporter outer membrane factor (OMF) lipoprotein